MLKKASDSITPRGLLVDRMILDIHIFFKKAKWLLRLINLLSNREFFNKQLTFSVFPLPKHWTREIYVS